MRKYMFIGILILMLASVAGCEEDVASISSNSVSVAKDKSLEVALIEDFAESYYSETELMDMVNSEVSAYNTAVGYEGIKVGEHVLTNGQIHMNLNFAGENDFNSYLPENIFVGTIQEAYDKGYDFNYSLITVGGEGATIGKNELMNMGNSKIVILNGQMIVRCPSKILYYSQGMVLLDDETVQATTDGCYFIIYK